MKFKLHLDLLKNSVDVGRPIEYFNPYRESGLFYYDDDNIKFENN
jgi:hypothetical protein